MPSAARKGDYHVCPKVDPGPRPHIGGPITSPCVSSVSIEYQAAATVGDRCTCMGPPDKISSGSSTVIINNKKAARQGDRTAHGGVIVQGANSVLIG